MKKDKDTHIEVINIKEMPNGGAEIVLELGSEAHRLLLQKGVITLLKEYIDEES
tara:strand:- start:274 stop:435 length:162 start_codon:yes stop_codon:yes gene_type:complete